MPRVVDLPPGWRHFSTAEKIEDLIGLDRCYEILSWTAPYRRDDIVAELEEIKTRGGQPAEMVGDIDGMIENVKSW
jgi:hypothetical protein